MPRTGANTSVADADDNRSDSQLAAEGLVRTGFGIESEADLAEWEQIQTGLGDKIDWEVTPVFVGRFTGTGQVEVEAGSSANGMAGTARAYLFTGQDGQDYFAWATYQLDQALEGLTTGQKVRIEWLGKRDIGKGQTVNRFRVFKAKH